MPTASAIRRFRPAAVALAIATVLGAAVARGERPPPEPFQYGVERDWLFLNQAQTRGSLVKIENGKVFIRGVDGVVREFWPGLADGVAASYLQRAVCRLPERPSTPRPAAGDGPLIDLDAAALPNGPLDRWPNRGRLGGGFTAMNDPPTVRDVRGRRAVTFLHAPWLLPLEFQTMVSDFTMPEEAIDGEPLTVAAWLYNIGPPVDRETFLCWGERDCGELDTPDFSFGCYEAAQWYNEKLLFPPRRFPGLERWRHLAFVLEPYEKDKNRRSLKVYVDGAFVAGRAVQKPPAKCLKENLAFLGCAWEAWWGHAWATRPARPFTGAIAGLQVYGRALDAKELQALAGPSAAPPQVPSIGAGDPAPAVGASGVPTIRERLGWSPDPEAAAQVLHLGTDREAVVAGKAASAKLKAHVGEAFIPIDLTLERLAPATTYHWRVESTYAGDRPAHPGEAWSFTTDEFDLEFDGPVSEAFPEGIPQDGFYARFMEAGGYPVISPPGNHDIHLRAFCRTVRKVLDRRPDLVTALQSSNAACHLASKQHRGWGWSPFTCSCYGEGEAILREGAIVMHEMGHQFHMQGAEALEPDFRERLAAVFDAARRERLWIGDYGGSNMWENVAVCASWWINDMTQDVGGMRPRELLRRSDPRVFHLLSEWWPGDTVVDLSPRAGVAADASGTVTAWANAGGVEYFQPNVGWRTYARTVGRFTSSAGKPRLVTAGNATAVAFDGDDQCTWDQFTWDAFDGNRAWSVDAWVWLEGATADGTLAAWRTKEAAGVRLAVGGRRAGEVAGKAFDWTAVPKPGRWHHVAWVYTGGGAADAAGVLQIFIDGRIDGVHSMQERLALPRQATITVGGGFHGAIGRLRFHDYPLHAGQVADIHDRERSGFGDDAREVAGRLLVDLDAGVLAPPGDRETWPTYPSSLQQPRLRSWVNRGLLAGKIRNDAGDPASRPQHGEVSGRAAVIFDGRSRMIADVHETAPAEGTLEAWVRPAADQGTAARWGGWRLPAAALRMNAWQHVAIVRSGGGRISAWIDGKPARIEPAADGGPAADRLVVGGERANTAWAEGFKGAIAGVRVHSGLLTEDQIRRNAAASPVDRPAARPKPEPRTVLLDLDAADLGPGPVAAWRNKGAAGGTFTPAAERPLWRPLVRDVEGVKGVDFSGRKGLVSSFALPDALRGDGSFTVSLRARYDDTRGLERDQTIVSWGRRPERAEFCWGSDPKRGAFIAAKAEVAYAGPFTEIDRFKHNSPLPGGWRHIAWAYDGKAKKLAVYVDGKRNRDAEVTFAFKPDERICLGGVRTGRLPDSPFNGLIAELGIAGNSLGDDAIAALAAGGDQPASEARTSWLVRVDASELSAGPLDAWPNAGSLGGSFEPEVEKVAAPKAEEVAGRAAVTFDGPATLVSDIETPAALTGDVPFTVEMVVFNPKVGDVETVFTLAPAVAMPTFLHDTNSCGAAFGFGSAKEDERTYRPAFFTSGQSARHVGWRPGGPTPVAGAWQHVCCVNTGGYRGMFRVYVEGELVNERPFFTLDTLAGQPMYIGSGWNTARGAQNRFTGSLARLRVHAGALTAEEVRNAASRMRNQE